MEKRMIVLVPLPLQGHLTPLMQLGKVLNSKGFSVTVALPKEDFNRVSSLQHFSGFQFITIQETIPLSQHETLGVVEFLFKLNKTSEVSFKNCIAQLLLKQGGNDTIACIIYDELLYFSEAVAKEFKLPSFIFTTGSATNQVSGMGPLNRFLEICKEVVNKRTASALIINTTSCMESSSLSWLKQELKIPVYPLGPLHITASTNYSLLEEDKSCIEWLEKQKPRSVIYISLGSIAHMETKEVLEMAWGLCNSNQPFLWVIRPGGSESLPKEVIEMVLEKGYIVKWAPQNEVLRHVAVGGFWSHCGWNSTIESIVEGVPMICRPFNGEQKLNAMYVESVWSVGIQLEGEVERREVERAVKRLIVDAEGAGMRERAIVLKEKLKASVRSGGFSYNALDELVKHLETE